MKKSAIIFCLLLSFSFVSQAQDSDSKYLEKVNTLDNTIETLYAVISGEKGEKRDWDLFRYLFKPNAKLIPSGKSQSGSIGCRFMSPDDYINSSGKWLEGKRLF